MRGLRALLVFFVVLMGQAHACTALFLTDSGTPCSRCPTTACQFTSLQECQQASQLVSTKTFDCHFCCKLTSCEDRQTHAEKALTISVSLEVDLPFVELLVMPITDTVHHRISVFAANQFANPPPRSRSSRAPPLRLS